MDVKTRALSPKFQFAKQKDIDTLCDMMDAFYAIDEYPFDRCLVHDNLELFLKENQLGRIWLISLDDKIVGYIILTFGFSFEFGGRDAFVDELYLRRAYRNKGIGTTTLSFVADQAKNLGIKALHLEVEPHNEKGKAIYKKGGYKAHDRILMTKML